MELERLGWPPSLENPALWLRNMRVASGRILFYELLSQDPVGRVSILLFRRPALLDDSTFKEVAHTISIFSIGIWPYVSLIKH
jgi:hypothetical protein